MMRLAAAAAACPHPAAAAAAAAVASAANPWLLLPAQPWLRLTAAAAAGGCSSAVGRAATNHHHCHKQQQWRWYSSDDSVQGKIGADPDEVAELIESNLARPSRLQQQLDPRHQAARGPLQLLTTRREALSLYREVLRYSNLFVWRDEHGRVWRDVIRASARQEFEVARAERDPELINRMIVTARDAVQRTVEGFLRRRERIIEDEEQRRPQGPLG